MLKSEFITPTDVDSYLEPSKLWVGVLSLVVAIYFFNFSNFNSKYKVDTNFDISISIQFNFKVKISKKETC